jgi:glycosyltransferase involved in cell wall biosynthesis
VFSIVTPSFQNSGWLKFCIQSVADQGLDVEHIIQDAGSNDGTLDWLPGDSRVRAFVEKDQGMYDALRRGLRRARGQVLAHLNCDEQYLPGALQAVEQFFDTHPSVQVVFADAVVVDQDGGYLWHRKALVPRKFHTACFPLSTLTCATFFRREVIENPRLEFDPRWRYCGDGDWVLRLLQEGVRMAVLRRFTSAFTHTGKNLSLNPDVQAEARRFHDQAPSLTKALKPLVLLHHRFRRLCGGVYHQRPFSFALYTRQSPDRRQEQLVEKPTFRWRW